VDRLRAYQVVELVGRHRVRAVRLLLFSYHHAL
jgi:hypothetical protein